MIKDFFLQEFNFGIVGFSEFGNLTNFNTLSKQEHLYGLQFETELELANYEYEISLGYLNGLTDSSSNHVFIWKGY